MSASLVGSEMCIRDSISTALGNTYITGADWIEWGSGSAGWLYKYQMKGLETQIYGFEYEFDYLLTDNIKLFSSFSISRGENLSEKKPLSYMPPDKFIFSPEISFTPFIIDFIYKQVFQQTKLGEFEIPTDGYEICLLYTSPSPRD